jgi:hypothetical protein
MYFVFCAVEKASDELLENTKVFAGENKILFLQFQVLFASFMGKIRENKQIFPENRWENSFMAFELLGN